jgi:LuxR family glucitol operon transcriptional activator
MATRSDHFGRLLKAGISSIANCEGKTAPGIEEELGQQIGVASYTIQRYKTGHLPPEARSVQILAEACVRRGYLNRDWLQAFLHAARYPTPESLLDQLCPSEPAGRRPQRVYTNLPAPTYNQFVMREAPYAEILDGLRQRSSLVLISSLGGMGKTSLAREIAARSLSGDLPDVDAVVWVSDTDRPGTTNLSVVLNEIARTLDYPGITQFSADEKRYEVEQLLRRQKVLLIIDNFETITDDALLQWVLRLPEPSKAIITTREYRREFRSSWPIDLSGMTDSEARLLIDERLRMLKIEKLVDDRAELEPLIAATGGNPKAIELALGLIKHERRSLQQVIDSLHAARGELFDDLFSRVWSLLDEPTRRVLLALTLFPASASHAALRITASIGAFVFDRSADLLADLSLFDVQYVNIHNPPRYALHPLVRAFAREKLAEQPGFEADARERWVEWYCELAGQVGFCWNDLHQLDRLDAEHETLYAAITWTFAQQQYAKTIALIEGVRYYYHVRGLWDDRLTLNLLHAEAAQRLGERSNEALALAHHIEIRSKQGNMDEAARYHAQLGALTASAGLPDEVVFEIEHAQALYARACGDLATAEQLWRHLLDRSRRLGGQKYVINRRWLATCRYQQGAINEAQQLFRESLEDARRIGDQRSAIGNTLKLAAIDLDQGDLASAEAALAECRVVAEQFQDRRRLGELERLTARLHVLRGDELAARAALLTTIDLFERMGMRRELYEARTALEQL